MIRVGLQLAPPGGRFTYPAEAWALDLPGCHVWADDEAAVLVKVPRGLARFLTFLARHKIHLPVEASRLTGGPRVVERFASSRDGEYEIDAAFADDERPVSPEDLAYLQAVLAGARRDVLEAATRAGAGRPGDRTVEEILAHVATGEWWYGTRLEADPGAKRAFARFEEPDPRARLASVREWTLARLDRLLAPAAATIHRGERWTPRKLLRRYAYHEVDHLFELEDRAARGGVNHGQLGVAR